MVTFRTHIRSRLTLIRYTGPRKYELLKYLIELSTLDQPEVDSSPISQHLHHQQAPSMSGRFMVGLATPGNATSYAAGSKTIPDITMGSLASGFDEEEAENEQLRRQNGGDCESIVARDSLMCSVA